MLLGLVGGRKGTATPYPYAAPGCNAMADGNAAPCANAYANPVRVYVYREPQLRDRSCNAHANPVRVYGLRGDELR